MSSSIIPKSGKHTHLDIRLLPQGGYIINDGYFNHSVSDQYPEPHRFRNHIICFSTLNEVLEWIENNFENKPAKGK